MQGKHDSQAAPALLTRLWSYKIVSFACSYPPSCLLYFSSPLIFYRGFLAVLHSQYLRVPLWRGRIGHVLITPSGSRLDHHLRLFISFFINPSRAINSLAVGISSSMASQRTSQTPPHLDSESVTSGQTSTSQMPMHHYPEDQRQQQNVTPYTDRSEDDPPPSYTVVDNEGPHANPFDLLPTSSSSLGLHPFKGTSNDKVVYYLDKRLDTDPEFLEQHISELAKEPPRPYVRIQGLGRKSSKDGIDFDIHIELTPLLYQEMATRRSWRRIRAVNNFDKVRRGTTTMTRAPGFGGRGPPEEGTPGVAQWCYRYCASKAGLKVFVLERRLTGWDFALVGSRLESLVRGTGYRGEVNITFPTTNARVEIYNRCITNRWRLTRWIVLLFYFTLLWIFTWPWVSLRTRWYETVFVEWSLSRPDRQGTLRYACMSEDQWFRLWRRPIEQAIRTRRRGRLSRDDIVDECVAPGAEDSARGMRAGLEVLQRTFGWGGDGEGSGRHSPCI
ncbi:hypothetical protein FOTG_07353 [Fusarium oxysporum f. sp. vasinfectum 25433]|nr:hypothetical protein FOTG_07353 [Fusarium oxysporum f. sp. vasinfectum 25433]